MNALKILKPGERFQDLQKVDRNLANEMAIKSVNEVLTLISHYKSELTSATTDKIALLQKIANLNAILETRISLTMDVLNIKQSSEIPTVDEDLVNQPIEERQAESEETKDTKVIPINSLIKKENNKKEEKPNNSKVKNIWFKGYKRNKIFATPIELPEEVQVKIVGCDTESKIDEIAFILLNNNRAEDALNLSIDLFDNLKVGSKTQEEVEKRFLFEILPYWKEVECPKFDDMQNISLSFWINHLTDISNDNKLFNDLKQQVIEEVKNSNQISLELANTVYASNLLKGKDALYDDVKKELNIDSLVFATKPKEQNNKPTQITEGLILDALKQECLTMLKDGDQVSKVHQHFKSQVKNTTDTSDEQKKNWSPIWGSIMKEFKETPLEDIITPEVKEEIVNAAEEAANKGIETLTEDIVESNVKHIILEGLRGNIKSAMNAVRQYLSIGPVRKLLKDVSAADYYKKIKEKVINENQELVENKPLKPIAKNIDLAKEHPDVLESVNLCNNIEDLRQLIIDIVFNKNTMFKDSYSVAYAATKSKLTAFEGQENWDQTTVDTWFKDVIRNESSLRKKEKESVKEESAEIINRTSEEIKKELENDITNTPKDFSYISEMKKADAIRNEVVRLVKKGEKIEDLSPFIFKSLPFMSCKNKPAEQEKVLNNIKKLF